MNFYIFDVKNSYLIYVLLKISSFFFWEFFLQYTTHFYTISLKNIKNELKNREQK